MHPNGGGMSDTARAVVGALCGGLGGLIGLWVTENPVYAFPMSLTCFVLGFICGVCSKW